LWNPPPEAEELWNPPLEEAEDDRWSDELADGELTEPRAPSDEAGPERE
jgi:hypothetical protein